MLSIKDPASNIVFVSDIIETELLLERASKEHQKIPILIEFLLNNYQWAKDQEIKPEEIVHWDFGALWSLWIEIKNIPHMTKVLYNGNRKELSYIA